MPLAADMRDPFGSLDAGQMQIEEYDIGAQLLPVEVLDGFRLAYQIEVVVLLDREGQSLPVQGMIIDDGDGGHSAARRVTRVPAPGVDSTTAVPPASCIRREMDSPIPKPPFGVVTSNPTP